jgi:hypothetical protein
MDRAAVLLLLWALVTLLAAAGIVLHFRQRRLAVRHLHRLRREGLNGWLLWAARAHTRDETARTLLKATLTLCAGIRLATLWPPAPPGPDPNDVREFILPLLLLGMLAGLTLWSWHQVHDQPEG